MALEISFRNSILLQAGNGILRIGKITYYENSKWSFFANGINGSGAKITVLYFDPELADVKQTEI